MPESLSIASPSAVSEPTLISRNTTRVAISILLTVLDFMGCCRLWRNALSRLPPIHPICLPGSSCSSCPCSLHWQEPGIWRWLSGRANPQPVQPNSHERRVPMPRSLGKMSPTSCSTGATAPPTPSNRTVQAFLELGEAVATAGFRPARASWSIDGSR